MLILFVNKVFYLREYNIIWVIWINSWSESCRTHRCIILSHVFLSLHELCDSQSHETVKFGCYCHGTWNQLSAFLLYADCLENKRGVGAHINIDVTFW